MVNALGGLKLQWGHAEIGVETSVDGALHVTTTGFNGATPK